MLSLSTLQESAGSSAYAYAAQQQAAAVAVAVAAVQPDPLQAVEEQRGQYSAYLVSSAYSLAGAACSAAAHDAASWCALCALAHNLSTPHSRSRRWHRTHCGT